MHVLAYHCLLRLSCRSSFSLLRASRRLSSSPVCKAMDVKLRLVQFECEGAGGRVRLGAELSDGRVVDFSSADAEDALSCDMQGFLEQWESSKTRAARIVEKASASGRGVLRPDQFQLRAPITRPEKILCIGMNYVDHCEEQNYPVPDEPILFSKFNSSITHPGSPVHLTAETQELDYEVEMAFVVCKEGKNVKEADALSHVAGCTVANDVSARDLQMRRNGKQWLLGKTLDSYCPLGPALVTLGAISDPHNLGIRCRVNGEVVQSSSTNQLVFKIPALIAYISRFMTLRPGDIVLTGTPPGVGCFRHPPVWLKKGDVMECEVDEIGKITNTVC